MEKIPPIFNFCKGLIKILNMYVDECSKIPMKIWQNKDTFEVLKDLDVHEIDEILSN